MTPTLQLRDWWMLRLSLVWAYRGEPGSRWHVGPEPPQTLTAWRLDAGEVKVKTPQGAGVARAGQWMITHDREQHAFSRDARILSVQFLANWLDGRPLLQLPQVVVLENASHRRLDRAANALVRVSPKPASLRQARWRLIEAEVGLSAFLTFRGRFHRFLEAWIQAMLGQGYGLTRSGDIDPRTAEAIRRIEASPLGHPIDFDALAASLGISLSQLNRLFARDLHTTPRAYENDQRLANAKRLLAIPEQPIKQIAYQLGFKQPSHFTAWFRRGTGYTPSHFRGRLDIPGEAIV